MENRLEAFDCLRSVAILIILFHHLPGYCFNFYNLEHFGVEADLSLINELNRYFGLGLFIFVSGYLANLKERRFAGPPAVGQFFLKKAVRIFPLYYLALAFFCYMYDIEDPLRIMAHLFGLHVLLAPGLVEPSPTLWFIGLILMYYGIYVFVRSERVGGHFKAAGLILFPFLVAALHRRYQIMDERVVLYYGIFLLGLYAARNNVLERLKWPRLLVAAGLLAAFLAWRGQGEFAVNPFHSGTAFATVNAVMLVFIGTLYKLARLLTSVSGLRGPIEVISIASFCMFLFHRPIWFAMEKVLDDLLAVDHRGVVGIFLVVVGIPVIVFTSYHLQRFYDRFARGLTLKLERSPAASP